MTDIVEAMARALIWTKLTELGRAECKWPDDFGDDECAAYRGLARAALTAALDRMAEPSEAMKGAAHSVLADAPPHITTAETAVWQAMLDQLRKEALP